MSRDIIDIPEVFKRGMEEWQERNSGSGDGGEGRNNQPPTEPFRPGGLAAASGSLGWPCWRSSALTG